LEQLWFLGCEKQVFLLLAFSSKSFPPSMHGHYLEKRITRSKPYHWRRRKQMKWSIKHTFCLRLTRMLPAASFRKRRSCKLKSLLLTWKMRVPLMSDTLKSFSPRLHSFVEMASSTGYCARYCGPINTTGCSTGGYVLIAGTGLLGACPVAIITKTQYYLKI